MNLEFVIYKSLQHVQSLNFPVGEAASGKKFEDHVVMQLWQELKQQREIRVFPPRHTLGEATFSGVHHQFDIVVSKQDQLVAIECKFRGNAHIDQLFATCGKLIDYCKRPLGIFVTTASCVNEEIYYYALAHHILIICNLLPPVEYMLHCVKKETDLANRLQILQGRMKDDIAPKNILTEWKNAYTRFQDEGYSKC